MCRLSLAWVTSENSTMLLESDSSWLTLTGPYPTLPRLSAPVSGVDCPSVDPRQPLYSPLSVQPPTALCWVASSTLSSGSPVNCLSRVPFPLPDTARFHVQESFVWFRAKTDSSALAAYPHSATLCGDRGETINHIISECSKLIQREYNARHDCVGKLIHWDICKKLKFDHTNER